MPLGQPGAFPFLTTSLPLAPEERQLGASPASQLVCPVFYRPPACGLGFFMSGFSPWLMLPCFNRIPEPGLEGLSILLGGKEVRAGQPERTTGSLSPPLGMAPTAGRQGERRTAFAGATRCFTLAISLELASFMQPVINRDRQSCCRCRCLFEENWRYIGGGILWWQKGTYCCFPLLIFVDIRTATAD